VQHVSARHWFLCGLASATGEVRERLMDMTHHHRRLVRACPAGSPPRGAPLTPLRTLAGFTRIRIEPGQTERVRLQLVARTLGQVDEKGDRATANDRVLLHLGRDVRRAVEAADIYYSRRGCDDARPPAGGTSVARRALAGRPEPCFRPLGLVRVHRNHAVNIRYVREVRRRQAPDDWEVRLEPPGTGCFRSVAPPLAGSGRPSASADDR